MDKTATTLRSSLVISHFICIHRLVYGEAMFEAFVEHLILLIEWVNIPTRVFSDVAIRYMSVSNFRSTIASSSSNIVISPLLLRSRQINIQQTLVRQIIDTTLSCCVNNQHAHPRWRPGQTG